MGTYEKAYCEAHQAQSLASAWGSAMGAELRCDRLTAICYAYRLSEQRVHDLLEGLCSVVSKSNMLYTSEEGNQTWAKSAQPGWTAPKKAEEEGKFPIQK